MNYIEIGEQFFIPFFEQLWSFLGTPLIFGFSIKTFLVGGFVIRLSISILTMLFGLGGQGGAKAYKAYKEKHKKGEPAGYSDGPVEWY